MNGTRSFTRSGKNRTLVYVGLVVLLLVLVYIFREAHRQISESRLSSEKCYQQQESLSAQFQVIHEYKTRLEKSLQEEKSKHSSTKTEFQQTLSEEREARAKEKQEAQNKHDSMYQQNKILQNQKSDLQEELDKLNDNKLKLVEDRNNMESQLDLAAGQKSQLEKEVRMIKTELEKIRAQQISVNEKNSAILKEYQEASVSFQYSQKENRKMQNENRRMQSEIQTLNKQLASCGVPIHESVAIPQPQQMAAPPGVISKAVGKTSSTEASVQQPAPLVQVPHDHDVDFQDDNKYNDETQDFDGGGGEINVPHKYESAIETAGREPLLTVDKIVLQRDSPVDHLDHLDTQRDSPVDKIDRVDVKQMDKMNASENKAHDPNQDPGENMII